ncbi:MAG: J domain-containing protein [Verrucomicrobiota bacterium]
MKDKIQESSPLQWPLNWPRTPKIEIGTSKFGTRTIVQAFDAMADELIRLGAQNITVSYNPALRTQPTDKGVAVYFTLKGQRLALAGDKWNNVADNLWAIAKHVEALRGQKRWGIGTSEQAFAGYKALPQSTGNEPWFVVLGVSENATSEQISAAYKEKCLLFHPDKGGSNEQMAIINRARDFAKQRGLIA